MTRFCTIADFEAAAAPTAAEAQLIEAARNGTGCTLNGGARPDAPTEDNRIRAELLRLVITGGSPDCGLPEVGIYLTGAWVDGGLDLSFAAARGMTILTNCTFPEQIVLLQASLHRFSLQGSRLAKGMNAAGLTVTQGVYLRDGFVTEGPVVLTGATIGGQLNCSGATFDLPGQDPDNPGHYALAADSMRVANTFFWKKVTLRRGVVHLGGAEVGGLNDDFQSWRPTQGAGTAGPAGPAASGPGYSHCLVGFSYDHLWGEPDEAQRRDWLDHGTFWRERFRPQPYRQLAQVLRRQGHDREARHILVAMERRIASLRQQDDRRQAAELWAGTGRGRGDLGRHWITWRGAQAWDAMFRGLTGYGYLPHRALWWFAGLVLFATALHLLAHRLGVMVPEAVLAGLSAGPEAAAAPSGPPAAIAPAGPVGPAGPHQRFSAFGYALDLSLPIIDLGEKASWGASGRTAFGTAVRILGWGIELAGGLITGLGLAAATGLVKRERE